MFFFIIFINNFLFFIKFFDFFSLHDAFILFCSFSNKLWLLFTEMCLNNFFRANDADQNRDVINFSSRYPFSIRSFEILCAKW